MSGKLLIFFRSKAEGEYDKSRFYRTSGPSKSYFPGTKAREDIMNQGPVL